MTDAIQTTNLILMVLFACCYAYQMFYLLVGLVTKPPKEKQPVTLHRFGVLIPARNEEDVIAGLLESIRAQDYPCELIDVYVIADNCTDDTAERAAAAGAQVIPRYNQVQVGKGYAMDYALGVIDREVGLDSYDAFLVFDADNVLDPGYFTAINRTFSQGYEVVTSYRNSKNYGSNWISAGYALWFIRESRFLNGARMRLGTSCVISGTGFLVSTRILQEDGGWPYHLLTEDTQFSAAQIIRGRRIGYCRDAVLYDEQPVTFRASWDQRMRWTKGFYQVFARYGGALARGAVLGHSFQCFDLLMTIASATLISLASILANLGFIAAGLVVGEPQVALVAVQSLWSSLSGLYLTLLLFGAITLITERRQIHCSKPRQLLYLLMLPVFIYTYIPMSVAALRKNVTWKHIPHSIRCTSEQICEKK